MKKVLSKQWTDSIDQKINDSHPLDETFSQGQLDEWARDNGYKKENL